MKIVWNCLAVVFYGIAVLALLLTTLSAYLMSQGYLYHMRGWNRWFVLGFLMVWGFSSFQTAKLCRNKAIQR